MKLTKGKKPEKYKIPDGIAYRMKRTGDYIEIEINDVTEINKLKAKGFVERT